MMNCKIGETIRTLRLRDKMTQEQLADRLGVSYQSISRWENGITYPDIDFLPAIARLFSVTLEQLFGEEDEARKKAIRRRIHAIPQLQETEAESLIELIRLCRREQDSGDHFAGICYALRYSPLAGNPAVLEELRKSSEPFFASCTNAEQRAETLEYYASLEDEDHIGALLDRYAADRPIDRDHLLKERYLFRDEFTPFDEARQRCFYRQITRLIDGDISLWRDSSRPMEAEQSLFELQTKLNLLQNLCREQPEEVHPITCGNPPDVFAEQRIFLALRLACVYTALSELDKAFAVLEDGVALMEALFALPDGTKLGCASPALKTYRLTAERGEAGSLGLYQLRDNGEREQMAALFPESDRECLLSAGYARWGWLALLRQNPRFLALTDRIGALSSRET